MRTVLTRFFPFSQDQKPIWNEFWYNCNISLQAKRWPAMAGHSLSVVREENISQLCGPAFTEPFHSVHLSGVTKALRQRAAAELPPWCMPFWARKAFCCQHAGCITSCPTTPPPPHRILLHSNLEQVRSKYTLLPLSSTSLLPVAAICPHLHFFFPPPSNRSHLTMENLAANHALSEEQYLLQSLRTEMGNSSSGVILPVTNHC